MLAEIYSSTQDYIKSKLVNPFLGTLLFVWLVRNWYVVYSIFNFDKHHTWKQKTTFINSYFAKRDLGYEIWQNLWISALLFVSSFVILLITRYITNIYEFKLLPLVYKYSEDKNLVTKERYDQLLTLSRDKDDTIEKLRSTIERQEQLIRTKDNDIETMASRVVEAQVSQNEAELPNKNVKISNVAPKYEELEYVNFSREEVDDVIKKLRVYGKVEEFKSMAEAISNSLVDNRFVSISAVGYYVQNNLLKDISRDYLGGSGYSTQYLNLTELGNAVRYILE